MSAQWRDDGADRYSGGGVVGLRPKPRFSFAEIKLLLEEVKRNRYIILKKFNLGVSADAKKRTWAKITEQINDLGENHREVRQIMKKWADLKCDGKRRIAAMRSPHSDNLRKKHLGPVEKMVNKILMMSPGADADSDLDFSEEDAELSKLCNRQAQEVVAPAPYSYLHLAGSSVGGEASLDFSPVSSPDKDLSDGTMKVEDDEDSTVSQHLTLIPPPNPLEPVPDDNQLRMRPVHTYSRNCNPILNHCTSRPSPQAASSSPASASSTSLSAADVNAFAASSVLPPPSGETRCSKASTSSLRAPSSSTTADSTFQTTQISAFSFPPFLVSPHPPALSSKATPLASKSLLPPVTPNLTSTGPQQPPASSSLAHPTDAPTSLFDPLPVGASACRDHVAQLAAQSLQQQRASRMLLSSVSQSLEILAQSVQLLVESQQEFVHESLLLQRETVDVLKDFSNTALAMLRDKAISGQTAVQPPPSQ